MKRIISIFIIISVCISFLMFVPKQVSATQPTITNYGMIPAYGDVGTTITFWMTYTQAENISPATGYPKVTKYQMNWPTKNLLQNDSLDTNVTDGKQYYVEYPWYPVIGSTFWQFRVKIGTSAEVLTPAFSLPITIIVPATPYPFALYPQNNNAGQKTFTFNFTNLWGLSAYHVNITLDEISHSMIENDTYDTGTADGKMFYYTTNLTEGYHNYSFQWHESGYWNPERNSGEQWVILANETDWNLIGIILLCISMIILVFCLAIINSRRKE